MKNILKSVLDTTDNERIEALEELISNCPHLTDIELSYIDFIMKSYTDIGQTPTLNIMLSNFPELENSLPDAKYLEINDLLYSIKSLINQRKTKIASLNIMDLASKISNRGITENDIEALREFIPDEVTSVNEKAYDFRYFKDKYIKDKDKPTGLITNIAQVDELIGGCNAGTVTTILAYTSQFKSTLACNMAYHNSYNLGYNIAVISLEMPREDYLYNILGRHSVDAKFTKYPFVPHGKIRHHDLSDEEEEYLLNDVLNDLVDNSKGMLFVLDETDFRNMSYTEIRETLYRIDDICMEKTGTSLDAIVIDHAHLLKFTDNANSRNKSEAAIVNDYISFFRRLTQKFRKTDELDENGNPVYKMLSTILLAQSNRTGFENACKKKGEYSLLAIAEFNEIERASYRVLSIWTDDVLKASKEAMMCVLKNRGGSTQYVPMSVYADGESYVFGDIDNGGVGGEAFEIGETLDIDDFSDLLGDDMGLL